ncbi:hypothetical protein T12_16337 [Trichinella patagoniensis]|uniref:Uncharacterized protein n=1 Tax=Trichinella patagoniensis TaxID=990121 RepID=A0A0V1AFF0_9BILA|nr:hypothetical protein T12_16337 [Trichinella patagoniensis]
MVNFKALLSSLNMLSNVAFFANILASKRLSGNCVIDPDAALGVAFRSDCSKLRATCRGNSR